MRGLILFAHGARDPHWADPLHRLRARLQRMAPDTPVALAFLEFMAPDLAVAADELIAAACDSLTIVPIFLGQGGHTRRDLADLVAAVTERRPDVEIRCAPAVGEDDAVLDALAACCVAALARDRADANEA